MKKIYLVLVLLFLNSFARNAFAQTTTINYSGSATTYTVPTGCSAIAVDLRGARGGNSPCSTPGYGARVVCTLAVSAGQVLNVYVGGAGANYAYTINNGGYNGGAYGYYYGGGGGGATDVRVGGTALSNRVVVAGGGGGAGYYCCSDPGGNGGYPSGGNGMYCNYYWSYYNGAGGSQTSGGAGASACSNSGSLGNGGSSNTCYIYGGGGGGGYYGGGGSYIGGGGGGSSYTGTGTSGVVHTNGFNSSGNGTAYITPLLPVVTGAPSSVAFGPVTTNTTSVPPQFFTASGQFLTGAPVVFTAPTDFLVSLDGITWSSAVTHTYSGTSFNTNVYVRFTPTSATSYSSNIAVTGGGLVSTINIPVTGTGVSACSGAPTAGSAAISPSVGGSANLFSLSLSGVSSTGGLYYQWQSSPNNSTWTDINGAITPNYSFVGITANTYYRCVVTCSSPGGSSANSGSILATFASSTIASSSCTPAFANTCSSYPMNTSIASLSSGIGSLTDPSTTCSSNYIDQTSLATTTLAPGGSYTAALSVSGPYYSNFSVQIWIDFNNDGVFSSTESVGGIAYPSISSPTPSCTITIPSGAAQGAHRMRIMGNYGATFCCGASNYPSLNPCPTSSVSYGNVRDYRIVIGAPPVPACSGSQNPGITASTPTSSCFTFNPRLFSVGESIAFTGLSYQWQSSTTSPTSGFSNISGATGQGYVATISSVGPVYYRQTVTCASTTSTSIVTSDTLLPPPSAITGPSSVCSGLSVTLSSATPGGTWSSSNANATVNSTTGVVTGVNSGTTATITYTTPLGCFTTTPITINVQPAAISGTMIVCPAATTTLTNATTGGTWSSSNTALATVGASSGVVSGIAGGNPVITYTAPTGCYSTATITVSALAPITGVPTMCVGNTTALADATPGGTWSSSNPAVGTVSGTGVVYGVAVGTTTISYSVPSLGCTATITAFVTNPPTGFTVTGGGSYCAGGAGVVVGVGTSNIGISYQLYAGATPVGSPITGAGFAFNFPPVFASGPYGVVANPGTPCAVTGTGTVNVSIDPLPTPFSVSGGGSYCSGGSGVHVYLNSSTIGVNYQLFVNTGSGPSPVGGVVAGTSAALDFGLFTTAGTYTVTALNATTSCFNNMSGSATVSIDALPTTSFSISPAGSGSYCTGGSGVGVGLSGSTPGVSYQLLIGGVATGSPVAGTGSAISFGPQTTPGTYSIRATNTTTGCVSMISTTTSVSINPLPTIYTMTGGGAYCSGGTGVAVGLGGSQTGVNYQLYRGTTLVGSAMAGTGAALTYPLQTTAGSYTVIATNPTTTCVSNMFSSSAVSINPLPTAYSITAPLGNNYCTGGTGVPLGLSSSDAGVTYQLLNGATVVGAASGTGSPLNFGLITAAGGYTVSATTTSTGCVGPMSGSQTVTIIPLPVSSYSVTVTSGGNYCAGSTAPSVGLSGSQSGVTYQLLRGGVATGSPVSGTGGAISFGAQPVAGSYTVVASTTTTPVCTNNMTGGAVITVNPLPTIYTLTGGGAYCAGSPGTRIGISASDVGINYRLFNGTTATGAPLAGIGAALDFGLITAVGTYTVSATNPVTGCTSGMSGSTVVSINTLPTAFAVTSTATSYCAGGTGANIGLANSVTGISYQLFRGAFATGSPMAGTGSALDFGPQTTGTYTVVATNTATGCTNNMTGSITLTTNPLPVIFTVSGGGNYCAGGAGIHVYLTGSATGIDYQLYLGAATVGAPIAGTGGILDMGTQTAAGTYTVVAINPATLCTNNMAGSATIGVNPLPTLFTITGGGNYCTGGAGVMVGLTGSTTGVNYQLYNGSTVTGAPVAGTGSGISFGMQTAAGSYSVVATNPTTMCSANMIGSTTVAVNPLPATFAVTGGGNYCPGTSGSVVGLSGSVSGTNYQLYRGAATVGAAVAGTGAALSFGPQSATGIYTVVANNTATTCTGSMTGSVTIGLHTLPTIYNVTGGGNYCPAGTGVHVGVSGSAVGTSYQLYRSGVATGLPVAGTGFAIDFGLHTATGTYTIVATNNTTGCTNTMNGNAIVGISPLPTAQTVTGGGNYCAGSIGVHIGLASSATGVYYQLYNGATATGSPMAGTGTSLDFGLQTATGTYTIVGTSTSTTCNNTMTGSVAVAIDPLPTTYTINGGGNYCTGGTGVNVTLSGSDLGTDYQLFNGATMIGSPVPGTGAALNFGPQTAGGAYMVVASNATTMCTSNMSGSVNVTLDPPPTAFNVTGGGAFCTGGAGLHVMTSGSDVGTQYQLMNGVAIMGAPIAGTGFGLDFGSQTIPGTYTVVATNTATTCSGNMAGSAAIAANGLPVAYTVSGSGSSYCAGGSGINITLAASDMGVNYQLYNGATAVGSPVSGSGLPVDFGYHTATGTYTVKGIDAAAGCMSNMSGAATVAISPAPVAFTVTGGGSFCNGGTGVTIGLSGSNVGVSYQLYNGVTTTGTPVIGTGSAVSFGLQTIPGTYTVVATNTATTCNNNMTGSATVALNPLPASFAVTGGGNYCTGGTGVSVGLSGSVLGTNYQLWRGSAMVGGTVAGTGFPIDFGLQTAAGNYTVAAVNAATGCTRTMLSSVTVAVNALPTTYSVSGGGNYCPGGVGVHVGISGSNSGVMYQLYRNGSMTGAALPGTGAGLDFGLNTAAGTYTVIATNSTTTCTNNMSGSVSIAINSLPAVYSVVGGGNYCAGGAGVHIGLSGSTAGISYQAYDGTSASGTPVIGTGAPLDLGARTTGGTYTVIATDGTTLCSSNMTGSAAIVVNPLVSPAVTISNGVGDTVCSGSMTTFTAMAVNGGSTPSFQWTVNGSVTGSGTSYSYIPLNGDVVGVTVTSSATCAMPMSASNTKAMTVNVSGTPTVNVSVNPGSTVCQGSVVTFSAASTFGGSSPTYSWIKNGVNAGSSATYSYTPVDGDNVYAIMTSNYRCRLANTATSTTTTMEVDLPSLPIVAISAVPGTNLAPGQTVTFNAAVTNGGGAPTYQWYVNGVAVPGANSATFVTSNLSNDDAVSCEVTSGGGCAGLVGTKSIVVHVSGVGVKPVTGAESNIKLVPNPSKGIFTVKGTLGVTTSEEVSMEVTNMLGQVIYTGKAMTNNGVLNETIQLSSTVANGMYILNLRSGGENKVFHIVIEQ